MITSVYFLPRAEPRNPGALGEAVSTFVLRSAVTFNRITAAAPRTRTRAFKAASLRDACIAPEMHSFTLWNKDDPVHSIDCFVRDDSLSQTNELARFYEQRHGHVISAALPPALTDDLRALLATIGAQSPLAHGFIAGFERYADAMRECGSSGEGPRDLDPAREERLVIDGRRYYKKDKLRRLYPITIIGPDIWAALPPLPAVEPMPTIEPLGDCTLLTAWPTLCDPRDPAFLHGTRALRAWLWPYTIQNPADHVDNDPLRP